jgi:predicted kinase
MKILIPELALLVLIGPSGSGKSTFAKTHFKATEVISSDFCRGLVSDDENDQAATKDAFDVLHYIAAKRLAAGKLTVIDATNVQAEDRKQLLALARDYHACPWRLSSIWRNRCDRNAIRLAQIVSSVPMLCGVRSASCGDRSMISSMKAFTIHISSLHHNKLNRR